MTLGALGAGHRFIRGNHDNPATCRTLERCIPDGTYDAKSGTFYVGGGLSIDKRYRVEGVSWWRDEELSYAESLRALDVYADTRPDIVVSHECPESVALALFPFYRGSGRSVTRHALQAMLDTHRPAVWIFGHWHVSIRRNIGGTHFRCLNELETMEL